VFGGRVAVHSIGMYVYCACVCHTVHVGVTMNTVPLYHWSSLQHVHVHCMHVAILSLCPHTTFQCALTPWWIPLWPVRG